MQLSHRLETIAAFVTPGNRLADIGTDHGYIPIYLVEKDRIPSAIAMDINKGPLLRAENNIRKSHLKDKITTRLSDGLSELNTGEADTILIAGLGGPLMRRILSDDTELIHSVKELVLSPHSEAELIRQFLFENNFNIENETMLKDDGKFYIVIKAKKGHLDYNKSIHYKYGKKLLEEKNEILYEFLNHKRKKINKILDNPVFNELPVHNDKIKELTENLREIEEALNYYG